MYEMIYCDITSHSKRLEINTTFMNINNLYCFHTVTVFSLTKEHGRYLHIAMESFPGYNEKNFLALSPGRSLHALIFNNKGHTLYPKLTFKDAIPQ